jgi:hypothetical protein
VIVRIDTTGLLFHPTKWRTGNEEHAVARGMNTGLNPAPTPYQQREAIRRGNLCMQRY